MCYNAEVIKRLRGLFFWDVLAVVCLLCPSARAQSSATLKGIDLYRSDRVTLDQILAEVNPQIKTYLSLRNSGNWGLAKRAETVKADIEGKVRALGGFAYASLYYGEYFTSAQHSAYITFDVVDATSAATRLDFKPVPKETVKDPGGLLALWKQYSDLGNSLQMKGELVAEDPRCAGFSCFWGSETAALETFEKQFLAGAAKHKAGLRDVLNKDSDPRKREAALYALSYLPDGQEVAGVMTESLADPDEIVRGAALQVLSDISVYHKEVLLDVDKVIPALDFPSSSDRSKALAVMVGMSGNSIYRAAVLRKATPHLLRLLKLLQPSNHDLTYALLGMLSNEIYDRRDYEAWEKWVLTQTSEKDQPEKEKTKKKFSERFFRSK